MFVDVLVTSGNTAITTAVTATDTLTITSTAYGGGATIGHVPSGGTAGNFLQGDGTWAAAGAATRVVNRSTVTNTSTNTHDCGTVNQTDVNYIDLYVSGVYQTKNLYTAAYDAGTGKTTVTLASGKFPNGATIESITT